MKTITVVELTTLIQK